ncbi:MAG: hypothetical protein ACLFUU_02015 [Desulfobacteraceae bacterium]
MMELQTGIGQPRTSRNIGQMGSGMTAGFPDQLEYGTRPDIQGQYYDKVYKQKLGTCAECYGSSITLCESDSVMWIIKFKDPNTIDRFKFPIRNMQDSSTEITEDKNKLEFYPPEVIQRHLRKRKLTETEIKKALSIVGIIKAEVEHDLAERFREYLYEE